MDLELPRQIEDLQAPLEALRALATLRQTLEALELQQVENALRAGHSWQEIADCLGVTRQAVHKKFHRQISADIPVRRRQR